MDLSGRTNQKMRTREALLAGARAMMERGENVTVTAVAEATGISKATAYRYFPDPASLVLEAGLAVAVPAYDAVVEGATGPRDRVKRVALAFHDLTEANGRQFRRFLSHRLAQLADTPPEALPPRGARRLDYFGRALEGTDLPPARTAILVRALSVTCGGEAHFVLTDVARTSEADRRTVLVETVDALLDHFLGLERA